MKFVVTKESKNSDGSVTWDIEVDEEFKALFTTYYGLSEWSEEEFNARGSSFIQTVLQKYLDKEEVDSVED